MAFAPVRIERENWSGEGDLTQALVEAVAALEQVAFRRVEDAPASRADGSFNFLCNEIFVAFRIRRELAVRRLLRVLPAPVVVHRPSLTLAGLEDVLTRTPGIGPPDYSDEALLQYLRAARVIPAYQTRGPKVVEMVRIYEVK